MCRLDYLQEKEGKTLEGGDTTGGGCEGCLKAARRRWRREGGKEGRKTGTTYVGKMTTDTLTLPRPRPRPRRASTRLASVIMAFLSLKVSFNTNRLELTLQR